MGEEEGGRGGDMIVGLLISNGFDQFMSVVLCYR